MPDSRLQRLLKSLIWLYFQILHDGVQANVRQPFHHAAEVPDALLAVRVGRIAALRGAEVIGIVAPVEAVHAAEPAGDLLLLG